MRSRASRFSRISDDFLTEPPYGDAGADSQTGETNFTFTVIKSFQIPL